jgi:hypothetical protein
MTKYFYVSRTEHGNEQSLSPPWAQHDAMKMKNKGHRIGGTLLAATLILLGMATFSTGLVALPEAHAQAGTSPSSR